jgi:CRISPR-associated protein Cas4
VDAPDPIPVSALQHWCYCPRQCALIHVEQVFADNLHTLRGQAVHQQVDQPGVETRAGVRVERALPVWSDRLGLIGKADIVEFEADGTPYPVEYKHGSRSKAPWIAACDDLQLAAQALCLEEMSGKPVPARRPLLCHLPRGAAKWPSLQPCASVWPRRRRRARADRRRQRATGRQRRALQQVLAARTLPASWPKRRTGRRPARLFDAEA